MSGKQNNANGSKKSVVNKYWLSLFAFIGIGCIAIALLMSLIFKGKGGGIAGAFNTIGQVIAYVISILVAFYWVNSHRKIGWIVSYVIFVVTIVVLFILSI
ncbi:MAG: hypothetical protein J6K97_01970 [Clostridia bacterium]|nr:hypothetical protein [Clostridia bacterium]